MAAHHRVQDLERALVPRRRALVGVRFRAHVKHGLGLSVNAVLGLGFGARVSARRRAFAAEHEVREASRFVNEVRAEGGRHLLRSKY